MWKKILLLSLCLGTFMCLRLRQSDDLQPNTTNITTSTEELIPNRTIINEDLNATSRNETEDISRDSKNYTLNLYKSEQFGEFITDKKNMSLYMFEKDHTGSGFLYNDFSITCYDDCERIWPPYYVDQANSEFLVPEGLNKALLGSRMRKDGKFQYTYNHWPLYYYANDKNPGDTLGQNLDDSGAKWYLLDKEGKPIKKE
jgi:predicted lipoprotein with Yx(FWY)xxD motif